MTAICGKCGGDMEEGMARVPGTIGGGGLNSQEGPNLYFIVPGTPPDPNPLKAFAQGLADEPSDRPYRIRGMRCAQCGFVELYAP